MSLRCQVGITLISVISKLFSNEQCYKEVEMYIIKMCVIKRLNDES